MRLVLQRNLLIPSVTLGKLIIEGVDSPNIHTLELPRGDGGKGYCITQGLYNCIPHNSPKHPDTWEVLKVPGRTNILIHVGNYVKDTQGCILVGKTIDSSVPMVGNSGEAMEYLRNIIGVDKNFSIEIKD